MIIGSNNYNNVVIQIMYIFEFFHL